jgi:hypothetical protein
MFHPIAPTTTANTPTIAMTLGIACSFTIVPFDLSFGVETIHRLYARASREVR